MDINKTCANCAHCKTSEVEDSGFVCTNIYSDMCELFIIKEDTCEEWEQVKEGE